MINYILSKSLLLCAFVFCHIEIYSQTIYDKPMRAYIDGSEVLSYKNSDIEISVLPKYTGKYYGFGKEIKLYLSLKNCGHNSFDFNPSTIKAKTYNKKGKEIELDVYTANEYLKKINKNILWFGPDNVKQVNSTTTVKDGSGGKTGEVSTTANVYTGDRDEAYADAEEYVKKNYLKRNTVFEDQEITGIIAVESSKGKPFEINIAIDGDIYIFKYEFDE